LFVELRPLVFFFVFFAKNVPLQLSRVVSLQPEVTGLSGMPLWASASLLPSDYPLTFSDQQLAIGPNPFAITSPEQFKY
jgi:hypothetical protein